jgi:hypothetical protein|tara:strand:+ start:765 stop:980 length:216 start_codon:yes stop_codon:yes gene_type:complete
MSKIPQVYRVVVEGLVSEVHYVEAIGEHYASSEAYCEFMSRTKAVTGLVVRTDMAYSTDYMVPEEEVEDVL